MTTIIVGCGYLGQRLATRLRQRGERVYGTVRSPKRAAELAGQGIEPLIADVLVPDSLDRLPRRRPRFLLRRIRPGRGLFDAGRLCRRPAKRR